MSNQWLYFGCHGEAGHYLWSPGMRKEYHHPLSRKFDGALCPVETKEHVAALLSRIGAFGYSALAFWDYTVDKRAASNSIFFAPSLTASAATIILGAQTYFPQVWQRLPNGLTLHSSCDVLRGIDELIPGAPVT